MLATERHVSASTHNQALSALLFLYREVLGVNLPWLDGVNRPAQKRRIPSVLTQDEVAALFQFLGGEMALLAKLIDGTGMRLMERLRRRVKDVDFDRHVIIVREATDIRTVQELLGHSDVSTTMIDTHVLKVAAGARRARSMHWRWSVEWPFSGMCTTDRNGSRPATKSNPMRVRFGR